MGQKQLGKKEKILDGVATHTNLKINNKRRGNIIKTYKVINDTVGELFGEVEFEIQAKDLWEARESVINKFPYLAPGANILEFVDEKETGNFVCLSLELIDGLDISKLPTIPTFWKEYIRVTA